MSNRTYALIAVAIIGLAIVALLPVIVFWSIGVLFGYHIPVTFGTWIAALVMLALFGNGGRTRKAS